MKPKRPLLIDEYTYYLEALIQSMDKELRRLRQIETTAKLACGGTHNVSFGYGAGAMSVDLAVDPARDLQLLVHKKYH